MSNLKRDDGIENIHHVAQGEHVVSDQPDDVITTILGSCVATCLWDETSGIGGMNHILLPEDLATSPLSQVHGVNAMEVLINEMIKRGAVKSRIKAKLFGGAQMVAGLSDIGKRNGEFAAEFLRQEGIECTAESLGGQAARRVQFWPNSGRARQKLVGTTPVEKPVPTTKPNDVELF